MNAFLSRLALALTLVAPLAAQCAEQAPTPGQKIERGRYLVSIGGCNDCHTPGYAANGGHAPLQQWLVGDQVGFQGPWGTTYPTNLRLLMSTLTEQQWVQHAKTMQPRPPMPWFNVRAMSDGDLRAIHAFVKSLGPAGAVAPAALAPGVEAQGPVVKWPG